MKRFFTDPTSDELRLAPPSFETTDRSASELLQEANLEYRAGLDETRAWNRLNAALPARSARPTRALVFAFGVVGAVAVLSLLASGNFGHHFFGRDASIAVPAVPAPAITTAAEIPSNATHTDDTHDVTPSRSPQPLAQGRTRLTDGSVVHLSPASEASVSVRASNRTTIDLASGTVELQVAHQSSGRRVEVVSGLYRFVALGTQFRVRTVSGRVDLEVTEGTVGVMAGAKTLARVEAGRSWSANGVDLPNGGASSPPSTVQNPRPEPPPQSPSEPTTEKEPDCATEARVGATREAIRCYERQASGNGVSAELAMYEIARLRKDVLSDFSGALDVLRNYQARFPGGSLRGEVAVSALELLERLGRNDDVLSESQHLLDTPYGKERAAAIHLLRGNVLRRALHRYAEAEGEYAALSGEPGASGDEAQFFRADCLERMGRASAAAAVYGEYLRRPHARHAAEAKARLSALSP